MSPSTQAFLLLTAVLVVAFRTWLQARLLWNLPLAHGAGFFLGVGVPAGFYDGSGARWLRRYRILTLMEYSVEIVGIGAIVIFGRWDLLPVCAGGAAVLFASTFFGFALWTRAKLKGAVSAPARVAVPLQSRSLRNYISWRAEVVIGSLVALSWISLLTQGTVPLRWRPPIVLTYLLLGLFWAKAGVLRLGFRLPAERTEEHHRWFDGHRRFHLRLIDSARWLLLAMLAAFAALDRWPGIRGIPWLFWAIIGVVMANWALMALLFMRGSLRLAAQGKDLRPPVRGLVAWPRAGWLRDRGFWWTVAYLAGFCVVLAVVRR